MMSSCPAPFVDMIILFSLIGPGTLARNHLIVDVWVNFWTFNSFFFFFILFYYFYICLHVYTFFGPESPPTPASGQNLFHPLVLWFCWRENIGDSKKDLAFLLVWDKDRYTERFLALLPCICVLQPTLVHLCLDLQFYSLILTFLFL
jgi:hypothetical protein